MTVALGAGAIVGGIVNVSTFRDGSATLLSARSSAPANGASLVQPQRTVVASFAALAGLGAGAVIVGAGTIIAALFTNRDTAAAAVP
ncbi:MAG: hypothetical protein FJ137_05180 [Deltaproteobacteria bacterium]|nr:hypothetical protein [Deltaproteobacteria bacterium]